MNESLFRSGSVSIVLAALALCATGCPPDYKEVFESTSSPGTGGDSGSGGTTTTTSHTEGGGGTTTPTTSSSTSDTTSSTTDCDPNNPNVDQDGDGFSANMGDCNDCDATIGPNSIDIQKSGKDENCDGMLDEPPKVCDEALPIDHQNAAEMAYVLDICKSSTGPLDWGIVGALWSLPDGTAPVANLQNFHLGHGVLPNFGPNVMPRGGKQLLALSSGTARRPGDPGFQSPAGFGKGYQNPSAPGFPKETPSCPNSTSGNPNDATGLTLALRVPANVHGFSFDFDFYANDFPIFVCGPYNDFFYALLDPPSPSFVDANVAYDELGNPISLNAANFRVCGCGAGPCMGGNKSYPCPLGTTQLMGTGFDGAGNEFKGATGWLTVTVPADPGSSIAIRLGAYDSADSIADSTVLLDNWQWITTPGVVGLTKIAQ